MTSRHTKRKQRQEKLRQYGIDLPDIAGLPVTVIPLHVHAIKCTTQLIRQSYSQTIFPLEIISNDDGDSAIATTREDETTGGGGGVLDSVLQRVDDVSSAASRTAESRTNQALVQQRYLDSVQSWLGAIHRWIRDRPSRDNNDDKRQVPVAALQHLFFENADDTPQENDEAASVSIPVRRATLHLAGKLLEKSADCRKWLLQQSSLQPPKNGRRQKRNKKLPLVRWMDALITAAPSDQAAAIRLWQREGYQVLLHLESKGYNDLYPTLSVAIQRFQQLCPHVTTTTTTTVSEHDNMSPENNSMLEWRRIRNAAIEHWEQLRGRLDKMLERAQTCLDTLVPRLNSPGPAMSAQDGVPTTTRGAEEENGENDDSDDGIDWEDGWGDDATQNIPADHSNRESHREAVDRTIQAMRSTGGLQDGGLGISFSQNHTTLPNAELRERLDKTVQRLAERYMPRLSLWVHSLTTADSLVETPVSSTAGVSSWVSMSSTALRRRQEVLQQCVEYKAEVARILASANRLGVESTAATNADDAAARPRRHPVVADLIGARRNATLSSNLGRKRSMAASRGDRTRVRSNRIKIKFTQR